MLSCTTRTFCKWACSSAQLRQLRSTKGSDCIFLSSQTCRQLSNNANQTSGAEVIRAIADLRSPQTWYPTARRISRKWIVHIGPTNSGKTYQALSRLAEAENGVYCGPLRLLAWEVHEKLSEGTINNNRIPCDLLTGQEQVFLPDARHRASTIEMVDLRDPVDVAVIDEVIEPFSSSITMDHVRTSN
jgi:hypothetical protein